MSVVKIKKVFAMGKQKGSKYPEELIRTHSKTSKPLKVRENAGD